VYLVLSTEEDIDTAKVIKTRGEQGVDHLEGETKKYKMDFQPDTQTFSLTLVSL
jgi:hypothetical protein